MKTKKKKRLNFNKELNFKKLFIRCLLFGVIFLILGLITNLLLSFVLYRTKDPTSLLELGGIISLFSSSIIIGYIQSRINKQYYLLGGIVLGIIIFIFTVIVTLILSNGNITTNNVLLKALIPAFSVIGSMLGIKRERKRKKHHK